MKKTKILPILSIVFLLYGCKESFPAIEAFLEPEEEAVSREMSADQRVPISLSLGDPEFQIVTRGGGSFNSWNRDEARWRQAPFHVFAFQTSNKYGGECDMRQSNDHQEEMDGFNDASSLVLLNDRIMRIVSSKGGARLFRDVTATDSSIFFYRISRQNLKYNFFTYYADDAAIGQPEHRFRDSLTQEVEIDGTQDIMHSFAYHTDSAYNEHIAMLEKAMSLLTDSRQYAQEQNRLAVLTEGGMSNMLYSTYAGHRGLNPRFRINHLMSRFDILIAGAPEMKGEYNHVVITEVSFTAPHHGTLTVAANHWNQESYNKALGNRQLLQWEPDLKRLPVSIRTRPLSSNMNGFYDRETLTTLPKAFPYRLADGTFSASHYHINSEVLDTLAKSVIMPSVDSLEVTLKGYYLNYLVASDGSEVINPTMPVREFSVSYPSIKLPESSTPRWFQPGREYTIQIYVYGETRIGVEACINKNWESGGTIEINTEKMGGVIQL